MRVIFTQTSRERERCGVEENASSQNHVDEMLTYLRVANVLIYLSVARDATTYLSVANSGPTAPLMHLRVHRKPNKQRGAKGTVPF
jgi:hypothetical protein